VTFVAIGLGSNMGDSRRVLSRAARDIAAFVEGARLSPLYRTEPLGGPPQRDYLNAVLVGRTHVPPLALLDRLQELERAAGRRRSNVRDAPRPLDLDLLLYGREAIATQRLTVPHPRLAGRRFALAPLADLAPRRVVPGTGRTVARLLAEAPAARVERIVGTS
jgi:2-amino-4-hydroxy-6-hydroxymethyldihydropteridine diphosphokinase